MNQSFLLSVGVLLASALLPTAQAADVGVSINIAQPGFYGRIDVGRVPTPMVVYPRPLIIEQHPTALMREPIYLRVPPGHEKHWEKHCARYNACGQPVYFVQDNWYREVYAPRFMQYSENRGEDDGDRGNRHDHQDHRKYKKEHGHD